MSPAEELWMALDRVPRWQVEGLKWYIEQGRFDGSRYTQKVSEGWIGDVYGILCILNGAQGVLDSEKWIHALFGIQPYSIPHTPLEDFTVNCLYGKSCDNLTVLVGWIDQYLEAVYGLQRDGQLPAFAGAGGDS